MSDDKHFTFGQPCGARLSWEAMLRDGESSLAEVTGSAAFLHVSYRTGDGRLVMLGCGGCHPDDCVRLVRHALEDDAVSISIMREDVKPPNT